MTYDKNVKYGCKHGLLSMFRYTFDTNVKT